VNHGIVLSATLFSKSLFLESREIGTLAIDEDFLTVFKVGLVQVGSSANLTERCIVVIDATMDTMSIFMTCQEILLDTFAAGGGRAVFAGDLLANNRRVLVGTDAAALGLDHLIGKFLGRFGCHGLLF
jgi:translation initiation factor 6 (eIF-6)